ncbi:MAG: hypothetical protein IKX86_04135 [Clostridia bacterium]|nr:hypothetical protein [Clostridia bacterium]
MKKLITESKWKKIFDETAEGLCETDENGNGIYSRENFEERIHRIIALPEYGVIGFGRLGDKVKEAIRRRRLRRLKCGKLRPTPDGSFEVAGISWDVHWQTDRFLAIILRDYLRFFIKNTPAIGNCVFDDGREDGAADRWELWENLVNGTADEFDELRKLTENGYPRGDDDLRKQKELTDKAFADLARIFGDLSW